MTRFLPLAGMLSLALAWPAAPLHAQADYPRQPVKIVAANTAGTAVDVLSRVLAVRLSEHMGQQFVVENRPGGGGTIGADAVARSPADGYTLLVISPPLQAITPHLRSKLPYDPLKSFIPVTLFASTDNVMIANNSLQVTTVKDVIDLARKDPGKLKMAHAGIGFQNHLGNLMFVAQAGINVLQVAYKGAASIQGIAAGESDLGFATVPAAVPIIRAGQVRPIAVAALKRSSVLPDVPTVAESGLPGFETSGWTGLALPADTPMAIAVRLSEAVKAVLADEKTQEMLRRAGGEPWGTTPQEAARVVQEEYERYGKVIRDNNIKLD